MADWNLAYTIDVDKDNAIIYAKVYGRWRSEDATGYHRDFMKEVQPLLGKPWAKMVDVSSWKTSRDEVTSVLGRHMAWSRENGVGLSIYIINNPSTFRQLNEMFDKGGTKEISHTFRTWEEGEKFLKEHWIDRPEAGKATA